jgi:predicted signal transduction protein with EAL and GGDEF domain
MSARQLADGNLVEDVAQALDLSSLDPELLTLEITETMIMADEDEVFERLGELKGLGVRISVDDFGTGYSSIGHLVRSARRDLPRSRRPTARTCPRGRHQQ